MRSEDIAAMRLMFGDWKSKTSGVCNIAILSPSHQEIQLLKELFPEARVTELQQEDWDLNDPGKCDFDLILACNVFMCASQPRVWFENILNRCKYFWIQDNIRAWRTEDRELGGRSGRDNDVMRFSMPPDHMARIEEAYDLTELSHCTEEFYAYPVPGRVDKGKDAEAFLMFLRGRLR